MNRKRKSFREFCQTFLERTILEYHGKSVMRMALVYALIAQRDIQTLVMYNGWSVAETRQKIGIEVDHWIQKRKLEIWKDQKRMTHVMFPALSSED